MRRSKRPERKTREGKDHRNEDLLSMESRSKVMKTTTEKKERREKKIF